VSGVINGFFLGWLSKFSTLEKGIPSLLQVRFFFLKTFAKFWKVIFFLEILAHFDGLWCSQN
jgi:hypothetical protein